MLNFGDVRVETNETIYIYLKSKFVDEKIKKCGKMLVKAKNTW